MGTDDAGGSLAIDTSGVDAERLRRAELERHTFHAGNTVWLTARSADGVQGCHGKAYPGGAPKIEDCTVRVVATDDEGEAVLVRDDGGRERAFDPLTAFSDMQTAEETLFRLAGGRKYRISLRYKGDTIAGSGLIFDLRTRGDARTIPGQRPPAVEGMPAPAPAPASTPAPVQPASEALLMGQSPIAALIGSSIPGMDPASRLLVAFAFREAELERRHGDERLAVHERAAQTYVGLARESMRAATGGAGSDFYAAELARERSRSEGMAARLEQLSAQVHEMQVRAASNAPPASPMAAMLGQYVMPAVANAVVGALGPEGVQRAVQTVAGAVASASPGAPAAVPA
ncbi:MAG: hypothetical protein U0324_46300 [Polyangiales bacterium]